MVRTSGPSLAGLCAPLAATHSHGSLGHLLPWLNTSEWLHYGYAVIILSGLVLLRPGYVGRARVWWNVALIIQIWHFIEHGILLMQAVLQQNLLGLPVPTSILQLLIPRVELHLIYNALVFLPPRDRHVLPYVSEWRRHDDADLYLQSCAGSGLTCAVRR